MQRGKGGAVWPVAYIYIYICIILLAALLLGITANAVEVDATLYIITKSPDGTSDGHVSASATLSDSDLSITLMPQEHYHFDQNTSVSVVGISSDGSQAYPNVDYSVSRAANTIHIVISSAVLQNYTVYVCATPDTYQISLDVGNGTNNTVSPLTFAYGDRSVRIASPTPSKGYIFDYWEVTSAGDNSGWVTGSVYSAAQAANLDVSGKLGNVTLTAHYTASKEDDSKEDDDDGDHSNDDQSGKVRLTTYDGKTPITDKVEMTFKQALSQIQVDSAGKNASSPNLLADRAVITLLEDCTTDEQIVVAEDFELTIDEDEPCLLSSTYTGRKNDNAAIVEEDADFSLEVSGLFYAASTAIYDAEEKEDITEDCYSWDMMITGDELDGVYLLTQEGYSVGDALDIAEGAEEASKGSVELTVLNGKYAENKTVSIPDDVTVTLDKGTSLTLKKAVKLNRQTVNVAGTLNLTTVSDNGKLILTDLSAKIIATEDLDGLVYSGIRGKEVLVQKEDGTYIYTLGNESDSDDDDNDDNDDKTRTGTITITCGNGGTATPTRFTLAEGETQPVEITPDVGYELDSVLANGVSVGYPDLVPTSSGYVYYCDNAEDANVVISFVATPSFHDVAPDDWFYSDVMYATAKNLMVGYPDGYFYPEKTMTVAEYLTVMYRYMKYQLPGQIPTKSTTGSSWTEGAEYVNAFILSSSYQKITTTNLTRYAVADITYRVLQVVESKTGKSYGYGDPLSFIDVAQSDPYYTAVSYLSTVNILDGYLSGELRSYAGSNTITRAEIAKVLHRLTLLG